MVVATGGRHPAGGDRRADRRRAQRPPSPLGGAAATGSCARSWRRSPWASGVPSSGVALLLGMPASDGFLLRGRRDGRPRARGPLPTVTALAGHAAPADGRTSTPGAAARGGRDARLDHLHLHRQDRDADPQRDDRRSRSGRRGGSVTRSRRRLRPNGAVDGDAPGRRATVEPLDGARLRRTAASGRDGAWRPVGDPMEAALARAGSALAGAEALDRGHSAAARYRVRPRRGDASAVLDGDDAASSRARRTRCCRRCRRRPAPDRRWSTGWPSGCGCSRSRATAVTGSPDGASADEVERDLELLGLVGLQDPPRAGAARRRRRVPRAPASGWR